LRGAQHRAHTHDAQLSYRLLILRALTRLKRRHLDADSTASSCFDPPNIVSLRKRFDRISAKPYNRAHSRVAVFRLRVLPARFD
jgi:hypothetical protein